MIHEGSPSFGYPEPHQYSELSDDERTQSASLSDDFCIIRHADQTDRFIRAILEIPIIGIEEPFLWGVWASLSESNFEKYREHFKSETYADNYFGWFCNRLPYYPNTLNLKARAIVKPGGERPTLKLEPMDHPLARDHHHGISWEKAIEIAQIAIHGDEA
jgi:hypothetical protein